MKTSGPRGDSGMTLLEIIIGLAVVVIGLLGVMAALVNAARMDQNTADQVRAMNACRTIIETMKQENFAELWRRYNANGADDPLGANTAPGPNFAVTGLRAQAGDGDGMPGQIIFPTSSTGNLSETFLDARIGMAVAKDLNGDGDVVDTNVNTTYMILPVRVVVDWRTPSGPYHMEVTTFLVP